MACRVLGFLLATLAIGISPCSAEGGPDAFVDLGYAKYNGVRLAKSGVDQYLGMRFAQAPVGDLRWRAPKNPKIRGLSFRQCFYSSNAKPGAKLPVWLYIQGGAYQTNANHDYNGTEVVQRSGHNIIVVNFNYRVGAYGFLASEDVRNNGDLNVGLLDQRQLMKWVQKHISKFGGDPKHVVVHGTSAGAGSLSHHLTAYGGCDDKLFVGGISHANYWAYQGTVAQDQYKYDQFVSDVGCSSASDKMRCLRNANVTQIKAGNRVGPLQGAASNSPSPITYWQPVIDGDFVRGSLYDAFSKGKFVKVPLLIDTATDEASLFASNAATLDDFSTSLRNWYPPLSLFSDIPNILDLYPLEPPLPRHAAWFPSLKSALTDSAFVCPADWITKSATKYIPSKVWRCRFKMEDPSADALGLGTIHGADGAAMWGLSAFGGDAALPSFATTNAPIIPVVMDYFISFIRSLDPNTYRATGSPEWEKWGTGRQMLLETNKTKMETPPQLHTDRCNYWKNMSTKMRI
ncbi:hypothetical protein NW754_007791 [Fusarium falciforme]|nr:hypothetical protein NW754_007791 [Fusarium falciforme]